MEKRREKEEEKEARSEELHENRRVVGEEEEESRRGYKYAAPPAANVHQLTYQTRPSRECCASRQTAAGVCAGVALARISMLRYRRAESVRHVVRLDLKLWGAFELQILIANCGIILA